MDCIHLTQDREMWWLLVNTALKLRVSLGEEYSFTSWVTINFWRRTFLHGVIWFSLYVKNYKYYNRGKFWLLSHICRTSRINEPLLLDNVHWSRSMYNTNIDLKFLLCSLYTRNLSRKIGSRIIPEILISKTVVSV